MKPIYFFFLAIFAVPFASSAHQIPGDYQVPVARLVESPHRVPLQTYSQHTAETSVEFAGTALMPKAHGTAKVQIVDGGFRLQLHLEGLGPATQIDPTALTYILWAVPANSAAAQNVGELVVKDGEANLTTFTNLNTFAMIVTAEPYFAVKKPSALIVSQNVLSQRSEDPDFLRADLLPLRMDSKTPLDIYEARNAVRIARSAGAERFAAEPFHKALQLLQQAENIFARRKGHDVPDVKQKAREATEAAEYARAMAAERSRESRPFPVQETP